MANSHLSKQQTLYAVCNPSYPLRHVKWPIHPSCIIHLMHITRLSGSDSLKGSGSAVTSPSRTRESRSAEQLQLCICRLQWPERERSCVFWYAGGVAPHPASLNLTVRRATTRSRCGMSAGARLRHQPCVFACKSATCVNTRTHPQRRCTERSRAGEARRCPPSPGTHCYCCRRASIIALREKRRRHSPRSPPQACWRRKAVCADSPGKYSSCLSAAHT